MIFRGEINEKTFFEALSHELCVCCRPLTDATFFNVPNSGVPEGFDKLMVVKCAGCGRSGIVDFKCWPEGEGMSVQVDIRWLPKVDEVAVIGGTPMPGVVVDEMTEHNTKKLQEFKRLMFEDYKDKVEGPLPEDMMVVVGVYWESEYERLRKAREGQ